jgi:hypothetical protein
MNDRAASTRLASPMKGRPADKLPVSFRPRSCRTATRPYRPLRPAFAAAEADLLVDHANFGTI